MRVVLETVGTVFAVVALVTVFPYWLAEDAIKRRPLGCMNPD